MSCVKIEDYTKPILLKDLGIRRPKETSKYKRRFGLYRCSCGIEFEAMQEKVKSRHTKSCGCLLKKVSSTLHKTHGMSQHPLFKTWQNMINRCHNHKTKYFENYGGRGIIVCKRWYDPRNFIEDMYPTYKDGLTLDRENNDGNYERSNCKWDTPLVQSRKSRILRSTNKSGYRGVSIHKKSLKWTAQITVNYKQIHLGSFDTAKEGAKAFNDYIDENKLEHTKNIL